ncbi:hypothetical protein GI374_06925 [Paracoccus sp. S-4012]|uniref:hypothetical protein n=1 Tax=Paracoccus sp. S-4012 TaxID=2665648 RepID=UPI0012AF8005|nr:hypothetical protein [Paracoccus sp. S-4012]MRX50184.1 hypothetical protein [Paracoccus sp. S-4012]
MTNRARVPSATAQVPTAAFAEHTTEEQKAFICSILTDYFGEEPAEMLFAYLAHCGIPIHAIRSAHDIVPAFLGLYRIRPGAYDVDAAFKHLRWWPPIAARIAELEAEAEAETQADAEPAAETLTRDL